MNLSSITNLKEQLPATALQAEQDAPNNVHNGRETTQRWPNTLKEVILRAFSAFNESFNLENSSLSDVCKLEFKENSLAYLPFPIAKNAAEKQNPSSITLTADQIALLKPKSAVLEAMARFNEHSNQSNENLKISSITQEELDLVCQALSNPQTISDDNVVKILSVASFLQIPLLLERCQIHIKREKLISAEILELGYLLQLPFLCDVAKNQLAHLISLCPPMKANFKDVRYLFLLIQELEPNSSLLAACNDFFSRYLKFSLKAFAFNKVKLEKALGRLNELQVSSLKINDCTDEALKEIQTLRLLTHLELPFNSLSDGGLKLLKNLPLTHLNLSNSRQLTDIQALNRLPLTSLNLSHCSQLSGKSLESLQFFPLTHLDLSFCRQVEDEILDTLHPLPLEELNLSYCPRLSHWAIEAFAKKNPACHIIRTPVQPTPKREGFCNLQ